MRENKRNLTAILTAAVVGVGLTAGIAPVYGAPSTWLASPADSDWANTSNWDSGVVAGGTDGTSTAVTAATVGGATFGSSSQLTVEPDSNRQVAGLTFTNTAGNYVIGADATANAGKYLYLRGNIVGNSANTITFNSPIWTLQDQNVTAAAGETFNFNGAYLVRSGLTTGLNTGNGAGGTINFNGGIYSTSTSDPRANLNVNQNGTVNVNASAPAGQRVTFSVNGIATLNLNATNVVWGVSNSVNTLSAGTGKINVNASNAVSGTAGLFVGSTTTNSNAPVVTINQGQDYTGRTSAPVATNVNANRRTAGTGIGTVVGNVSLYDPDGSGNEYPNLYVVGQNGYTVSAATTVAGATLYANNATGSATGNSDVNIVTGTLAGNGFIVNTDVTIQIPSLVEAGNPITYTPTVFAQGVTLHKRQQVAALTAGTGHTDYFNGVTPATLGEYGLTAAGAATYGKLSPGASAGAIGTLTFDLGSKGLNIAYAVEDANTQALLFDLDTVSNSDKAVLLNSTVLHIGVDGLSLDDFAFTVGGGFTDGIYTLFDTNAAIDGTLGSNVTGMLGGFDVQLAFANSSQDIVLKVGTAIPEPTTLAVFGLTALGLGRRRRV